PEDLALEMIEHFLLDAEGTVRWLGGERSRRDDGDRAPTPRRSAARAASPDGRRPAAPGSGPPRPLGCAAEAAFGAGARGHRTHGQRVHDRPGAAGARVLRSREGAPTRVRGHGALEWQLRRAAREPVRGRPRVAWAVRWARGRGREPSRG